MNYQYQVKLSITETMKFDLRFQLFTFNAAPTNPTNRG